MRSGSGAATSARMDSAVGKSPNACSYAWLLLPLIAVEVYCMFPFRDKGDFAEIGTIVVNGIGSVLFILRALTVSLVHFSKLGRQAPFRCKAALFGSLLTPALVWTVQYIVHPELAAKRTLEAYSAGPRIVGAIWSD